MFTVNKKTLHTIYVAATKLIGKFTEIIVEVVPEGLWLTINVESYIRVFVLAEVQETGIFKIQQEVFQPVFNLRGDTLKCSFNKEQNILNVVAGTRVSLYVSFKVSKEEYEQPEMSSDTHQISLEASQIAEFKTKLNRIRFTSPDLNVHEYALVKNNKKRTSLTFATTNMCTRYKMESLLGDQSFELTIPIDKFRLALSMIDSESMSVIVTDNFLLVESDTLIVTLPALLDTQFLGFIESCDELIKNEALVPGSIQFDISKIQKTLASVRSISQGSNVIDFKLKGTDMIIGLESKIGTTKDKVRINENTIDDNLKFAIPELFMNAALAMSQFICDTVSMQFGDSYRYFLMTTENEGIDFFTLGPMAEE